MKLISVKQVYESITVKEGQWYNPFKDKHLYIEGIFDNRFLYEIDDIFVGEIIMDETIPYIEYVNIILK